jgi:hypothetical protein
MQNAAFSMIQLIPVKVALESNYNTLNKLKCLASTCRFASFRSNIAVLKNSLVLHLSFLKVLTACFGGKFLNRTWTSIKATEMISSYLRAPVQGWAQIRRKAIVQVLLKISAERSEGHTTAAGLRSAYISSKT